MKMINKHKVNILLYFLVFLLLFVNSAIAAFTAYDTESFGGEAVINPAPVAPTQSNPSPVNTSIENDLTPICSITVNDANGDTMYVNISANATGTWVVEQRSTSGDGVVTWDKYDNASSYSQRYYWRVNISDGQGYYSNETYYFTTKIAPDLTLYDTLSFGGSVAIQTEKPILSNEKTYSFK